MTTSHRGSISAVPTPKQLVFIWHMELQGDTMGLFSFGHSLALVVYPHLRYDDFVAEYNH
jgi:hypothetical protein